MSVRPGAIITAGAVALDTGRRQWTYQELQAQARQVGDILRGQGTHVLATLLDNGPGWIVADRAAQLAGAVHVPLPAFFTPDQLSHAVRSAGVDTLLALPIYAAGLAAALGAAPPQPLDVAGEAMAVVRLPARPARLPGGTGKITFTSGTTGTPKGVCLSQAAMDAVAQGLVLATQPLDIRRHLCVLPLPVLLENVAGVLAPLARGATCVVPPLHEVGLTGSSTFDPARLQAAVAQHRPHSMILLPQMLRAWAGWLHQTRQRAPDSLRLVAVGGAVVGARLLESARRLGIPAYEGYGLSEGASVQTLNLPGADRPGSAGRALPHARVRVGADGEIEVAGSLMAGYLGAETPAPAWWPTGDLGRIDADGFVHVEGRRKHLLITSFGRNVSPEWVEQALRSEPVVAQAVVFGDGQPALSAVLWPVVPDAPEAALQSAVDAANAALPDYARVRQWTRARAAFTPQTGLATPNGRPHRAAILRAHADALQLS
ncbi:AMP-binding protein [Ramlibacter sp.]|uniref:AMP-binding protein n=1 Tax=Ramlibacter sp. TaxID=1917967 RepID=UPI002CCB0076|nr:AMP-binding protein [Ramlibacter sp.]HWI83092.1 AMP-binding protein [Ramlibacter sp.]